MTADLSLAEIQRTRSAGQQMADLEHLVLGTPREYIVIAYEAFPNGASGDPITDPALAKEIGRRLGIGDPTDPAGFAIWTVPGEEPGAG